MMKSTYIASLIALILILLSTHSEAQKTFWKELPIDQNYQLKSEGSLPSRVDNSETKFFPEIISQHGWSCNQASSIGYTMTYEMNQLRDLDSKVWENHYAALFPWNFLNRCVPSVGVSYFDTWEIIKAAGCATNKEFPVYNDTRVWMSGYDNYYATMKNRVIQNYAIYAGHPEGLLKLKNYVYDHAAGEPNGGLANVNIASGGMLIGYTDEFSHDPQAPILYSFGTNVGHALTIVGYDDEIGYDLNHDGQITNDLDINNDNEVTMADWERGALILANTWGKNWGRDGRAYMMYRLLTLDGHEGGIWNKSTHVIKAVKEYEPILTMKVVMDHTRRDRFRLLAGYSLDMDAAEPDIVMGFPHFNYQGDEGPLYSDYPTDTTRFELGLDISSLVSDFEPTQPVKIFLLVDEKDPTDVGKGTIRSVSVFNYGEETIEYLADQNEIEIVNDGLTYVPIVLDAVDFKKVSIVSEPAESIMYGETVTKQLEATGGTEPYLWELVRDYEEEHFERPFPDFEEEVILSNSSQAEFAWVDLPFSFPYYGDEFVGLVVDRHGAIHFNTESYDYPYAIDTDLKFKVRKSLVPFGRTLTYTAPEDKISFMGNDTIAIIRVDATVRINSNDYNIQFATELYPDGRIEFHYGEFDQPGGNMYDWVTGISNGDGQNYKFASINDLGVLFQNYGVRFRPLEYPADVSLTDGGLLTCTANEPGQIWNIYVRVRDKNNQSSVSAIPISTVQWQETEVLSTAYPNPFIGVTTISYKVPSEQNVRLVIYDSSGRMVKSLVDENLLAGEYQVYWNGTNYQNRDVNPGIYFYRLEIVEKLETQKIIKVL